MKRLSNALLAGALATGILAEPINAKAQSTDRTIPVPGQEGVPGQLDITIRRNPQLQPSVLPDRFSMTYEGYSNLGEDLFKLELKILDTPTGGIEIQQLGNTELIPTNGLRRSFFGYLEQQRGDGEVINRIAHTGGQLSTNNGAGFVERIPDTQDCFLTHISPNFVNGLVSGNVGVVGGWIVPTHAYQDERWNLDITPTIQNLCIKHQNDIYAVTNPSATYQENRRLLNQAGLLDPSSHYDFFEVNSARVGNFSAITRNNASTSSQYFIKYEAQTDRNSYFQRISNQLVELPPNTISATSLRFIKSLAPIKTANGRNLILAAIDDPALGFRVIKILALEETQNTPTSIYNELIMGTAPAGPYPDDDEDGITNQRPNGQGDNCSQRANAGQAKTSTANFTRGDACAAACASDDYPNEAMPLGTDDQIIDCASEIPRFSNAYIDKFGSSFHASAALTMQNGELYPAPNSRLLYISSKASKVIVPPSAWPIRVPDNNEVEISAIQDSATLGVSIGGELHITGTDMNGMPIAMHFLNTNLPILSLRIPAGTDVRIQPVRMQIELSLQQISPPTPDAGIVDSSEMDAGQLDQGEILMDTGEADAGVIEDAQMSMDAANNPDGGIPIEDATTFEDATTSNDAETARDGETNEDTGVVMDSEIIFPDAMASLDATIQNDATINADAEIIADALINSDATFNPDAMPNLDAAIANPDAAIFQDAGNFLDAFSNDLGTEQMDSAVIFPDAMTSLDAVFQNDATANPDAEDILDALINNDATNSGDAGTASPDAQSEQDTGATSNITPAEDCSCEATPPPSKSTKSLFGTALAAIAILTRRRKPTRVTSKQEQS